MEPRDPAGGEGRCAGNQHSKASLISRMAGRNATRKSFQSLACAPDTSSGASRPAPTASGWTSTTLRAIRRIEDLPLGLLPRDRLDCPGANLLETALRLSGPGCVCAFVNALVLDALKQSQEQRRLSSRPRRVPPKIATFRPATVARALPRFGNVRHSDRRKLGSGGYHRRVSVGLGIVQPRSRRG